jgi:hypothetical protein
VDSGPNHFLDVTVGKLFNLCIPGFDCKMHLGMLSTDYKVHLLISEGRHEDVIRQST